MKKNLIVLIIISILATIMYLLSSYPKAEPGPCGLVPCPTTTVIPSVVTNNKYQCPKTGWVNCMPILTEDAKKACSSDAIKWYKTNCPNFKGTAY